MKNFQKGEEPESLKNFRINHPDGTWDTKGTPRFRSSNARYQSVIKQLKLDQSNLCAYCEIDLLEDPNPDSEDKRVEHFHPKSDTSGSHNWALDWNNLLATCHGGQVSQVADEDRYTFPDVSCDIPKANKILDDVILNPLDLPPFPLIFEFGTDDGSILVDQEACRQASIDPIKAQNTIDELHLDAGRLQKFRQALLDDLKDRLLMLIAEHGLDDSEAKALLAEDLLVKDDNNHWPAFFSTIRFYLLPESDLFLESSGYQG